MFLRQVNFHLPGGGKMMVDWQIFWKDGTVSFRDTKGMKATEAWRVKKRIVEAIYPVTIEEWKR